jgi:hypothetical protein
MLAAVTLTLSGETISAVAPRAFEVHASFTQRPCPDHADAAALLARLLLWVAHRSWTMMELMSVTIVVLPFFSMLQLVGSPTRA